MRKPVFGTKLIEVRKAKGLTQEEVAERCGVTTRTIQRIETGAVEPRAQTIKIICDKLGFNFFDESDTGNDVIESSTSDLKKHTMFWYVKDLFNLKTNAMRKISILSFTSLILIVSLVTIGTQISAQTPQAKRIINIQKNADETVKRVEVRFTNQLTYDNLVEIRNILMDHDILVNYKQLEFDENNHLVRMGCNAITSNGHSGSFTVSFRDSTETYGFFVDYSKDSKNPFCIGRCDL